MGIAVIAYHRPPTIDSACALAREYGSEGAFLAGGTELIPDYQRGRESARHLIALDGVAELHGIRRDGATLRIGALATIAQVERSADVRGFSAALVEAASAIGSPTIRSRATLGGNFCRAVPCADTPAAAIAAGARVRLVGPDGEREMPAEEFFVGARQTALRLGEMLVEVILPAQPTHAASSYERFSRRRGSSVAVASVAVRLQVTNGSITDVRAVYGAVSATPILSTRLASLLVGKAPSGELFAQVAAVSVEEAMADATTRRSDSLRRDVLPTLTRRALVRAADRANGRTT